MFYGAHCSNARAQWQLPRCPYLNYFGIGLVSLASVVPIWFAQLDWLESAAIAVMLCRGCLQGAGLSCD